MKHISKFLKSILFAFAGAGYLWFASLWMRAEGPYGRIILLTDYFGERNLEMLVMLVVGVALMYCAVVEANSVAKEVAGVA